jgi:parallel beta-helix repeat protein
MIRRTGIGIGILLLMLGTQRIAHAVKCGATVTGTVTLTENLICRTGHGLTVGHGATLDCAGHTITGGERSEQYGIYIRNVSDAIVRNCVVEHFEIGIRLRGATNGTVEGNVVRENTRYGIDVTLSSTGVLIRRNAIDANGDEGLHVSGSSFNILRDNTLDNNAVEGIYLLNSPNNDVIGNTIQNHTTAGIYIKNSNSNYLEDNTLYNDPIQLVSGSQFNILMNNTISGQRIKFDGAPNNEVINMRVQGSPSDAYHFVNAPGNRVINSEAINPADSHIKAASGSSNLMFQGFSFNAPLQCSVDSSSGVTVTDSTGKPVACGSQ